MTIMRRLPLAAALTALLLCGSAAQAQWDLSWNTVDGGGVMRSTGGLFELNGTIAQPDAGTLTGDAFTLQGGFWPGVPNLGFCRGDTNCDGVIDWRDIDFLVAAMNDNLTGWMALFPVPGADCAFSSCDVNADAHVDWRDIDPFVADMNTVCP